MINFYNGQITDLLPDNIKEDAAVQAISYALREGTRLLYRYTQLCYVYCNIDTMPDKILDLLAVELRTQYYSDTFDIETKRALVRNTIIWYMVAGTPAAVEELVAAVFGEGEVTEWFEYGGEPYWFKITTNAILTEDMTTYFSKMIRRVKNTRSHVGAIEIHREVECPYYAGAAAFPMYRPAAIRDGYNVNYKIDLAEHAGTATEIIYKPAAIIGGFKYEAEPINETTCAGTVAESVYKPAAITGGLKYEAEPINETTCAGTGVVSAYKQNIKEE